MSCGLKETPRKPWGEAEEGGSGEGAGGRTGRTLLRVRVPPACAGRPPRPQGRVGTPAPRSVARTFLATRRRATVWTLTLAEWPSPLPPSATGRTQAQSGEGPASPSQPTGHGINPNGALAQAALGKRRFWKGPERWHSCRWRLLRTRSHGGRADGPPVRPPSRQLDAQAGLDAQLLQGPPPGTGAQDLSCRRGPHSGRGFGSN